MDKEIEDADLADKLATLCYATETQGLGRTVSNVGGFQSCHLPVSRHAVLTKLISLVQAPFVEYLRKTRRGQPPRQVLAQDLRVSCQCEHLWVNVNRAGQHNRLHEHGPPLLSRSASGIYYPRQAEATAPAKVRFYDGGRCVEAAPRPGLLLLFPTNLLHEVDPVWPGNGDRLSVAFNLFVRWLDQPILIASFAGDASEVKRLLGSGVDAEIADAALGFRPLHVAAEAGHVDVVDLLLTAGADPEAVTVEGWCPLGLAAAQGHLPVVKYLLDVQGASPIAQSFEAAMATVETVDLRHGFSGRLGATAVAAERGYVEIVELLTGRSPEPIS